MGDILLRRGISAGVERDCIRQIYLTCLIAEGGTERHRSLIPVRFTGQQLRLHSYQLGMDETVTQMGYKQQELGEIY